MKKIYLFFILILLVLACSRSDEERHRIIPEKKLIEILKEIHIANAIISNPGYRIANSIVDSSQVFPPIYEKYGFTGADLDYTLQYYSGKPDELDEIYEQVLQDLNEMEVEILSASRAGAAGGKNNLWVGEKKHILKSQGDTGKISFEIPIDTTGLYTIRVKLKMYMDDMSQRPRLTAFFWHSDSTAEGHKEFFPRRAYQKDGFNKYYSVSYSTSNPDITHLKGWILDHDPQNEKWFKHLEIEDIEVYVEDKQPVDTLSRVLR